MATDGPVRLADFRYEEPARPQRKARRVPGPRRGGRGLGRYLGLMTLVLLVAAWLAARLVLHVWWPLYATVGGSMYPTILPGEIAVVARAPTVSLHRGEIVLAHVPTVDRRMYGYAPLVLHRIVAVGGEPGHRWIRTRGDHNQAPEPFKIPTRDVVGRLVALVPYVGYALLFLHSRFALVAAAALLGLYLLYRLVDWALAQGEAVAARGPAPPDGAPGAADSAGATRAAGPVVVGPSPAAAGPSPPGPLIVHDPDVLAALETQATALRELTREMHELRSVLVNLWVGPTYALPPETAQPRPRPAPGGHPAATQARPH